MGHQKSINVLVLCLYGGGRDLFDLSPVVGRVWSGLRSPNSEPEISVHGVTLNYEIRVEN